MNGFMINRELKVIELKKPITVRLPAGHAQ